MGLALDPRSNLGMDRSQIFQGGGNQLPLTGESPDDCVGMRSEVKSNWILGGRFRWVQGLQSKACARCSSSDFSWKVISMQLPRICTRYKSGARWEAAENFQGFQEVLAGCLARSSCSLSGLWDQYVCYNQNLSTFVGIFTEIWSIHTDCLQPVLSEKLF